MCLFLKAIADLGGSTLLEYGNSLSKLLSEIYPEYKWLPWKFDAIQRNFWRDLNNQRKFMEWAGKELEIKEMSDWYKVSLQV